MNLTNASIQLNQIAEHADNFQYMDEFISDRRQSSDDHKEQSDSIIQTKLEILMQKILLQMSTEKRIYPRHIKKTFHIDGQRILL